MANTTRTTTVSDGDPECLEPHNPKTSLVPCQAASRSRGGPRLDSRTAVDLPPQQFTGEEGEFYAHSMS
jgi:hypothetical protein